MLATRIQFAFVGSALLLAVNGFAQQLGNGAQAQQRYEAEVAACNRGELPAPAREACIRSAGLAVDRARGGPPTDTAAPSPDGRATVVAPVGSTPPASSNAGTTTSSDGRATIVPPSDGTVAR